MSVLSIVSFVIFMSVGVVQTVQAVCPPGWLVWRDACYILLPDKMNWLQAKEVCDRPGSSLVVPDSQEEQDFIWREMKAKMADYGAVDEVHDFELWIGCQDVDNNGILLCFGVNGDPIYKNWATLQPDYLSQICIRMAGTFDGQWGDHSCDQLKYAACEMNARHVSFCMPTDGGTHCPPHCLLNHGIKNLTTRVTGCAWACWEEPRCHSFNLWQKKGDNTGICQLNNATRLQAADDDYMHVQDCNFYEM